MRIEIIQRRRSEEGSIIVYFIILLVLITAIAGLSDFVWQTLNVSHRRNDMVYATELAEGGAALAGAEFETAFTNLTSSLVNNLLQNPSGHYSLNSQLSTSQSNVLERVITTPFNSGQSVTAQIWLTNALFPSAATIVGVATVGNVTQSASVQVQMKFGYGAAIISDDPGNTSTSSSKNMTSGNVALNGDKSGPLVVDGGADGKAVLANGRCNYDTYADVTPSAISMNNYNTGNQIPDYTAEGSPDQLFLFPRFIAVADVSGTHYTNLTSFIAAANAAARSEAGALEGVIVVDLKKSDSSIGPTQFPNGINVRGTLIFNFGSDFGPTDKIINTATVNINKADLSGLNPTDPSTYTTGYPPTYSDQDKNPVNVDIHTRYPQFDNFKAGDDLPAMMYNVGVFDLHGNVNICGAVYSPSFMEIENKADNQTQYFKGCLIGGGGIYVENTHDSSTVISYDPKTVDVLATSGTKGQRVFPLFWQ
ncbi:MAG TPA: hypothetical protein VEL06_07570 [Haliangiales bacterium]|nr:hypothetical protein [Haliangiales bacterium]